MPYYMRQLWTAWDCLICDIAAEKAAKFIMMGCELPPLVPRWHKKPSTKFRIVSIHGDYANNGTLKTWINA